MCNNRGYKSPTNPAANSNPLAHHWRESVLDGGKAFLRPKIFFYPAYVYLLYWSLRYDTYKRVFFQFLVKNVKALWIPDPHRMKPRTQSQEIKAANCCHFLLLPLAIMYGGLLSKQEQLSRHGCIFGHGPFSPASWLPLHNYLKNCYTSPHWEWNVDFSQIT